MKSIRMNISKTSRVIEFHTDRLGVLFFILIFTAAYFFTGCGKKTLLKQNSSKQHYVDETQKYLPPIDGPVLWANFRRFNKDPLPDLIILTGLPDGQSKLQSFINHPEGKFVFDEHSGLMKNARKGIRFFSSADLDGDHSWDLVLLGRGEEGDFVQVLFNNKKGYFYTKPDGAPVMPPIFQGIERVYLADIDDDKDVDMLFTGRKVVDDQGNLHNYQAQLMINNSQGHFMDATHLLMPPLKSGIVGALIADFDKDQTRDIFLVYGNGQNVLLMNNGLGEFVDRTGVSLPQIHDQSMHADWADFDQDEDNDLLVVNRNIQKKDRRYPKEYNYILENDGQGAFKKKSLKSLPHYPARRVYMLDADGNKYPDTFIITQRGPFFFAGKSKWRFANKTVSRLPDSPLIHEMIFGDVDNNGYLDILAITAKDHRAILWMDRFD